MAAGDSAREQSRRMAEAASVLQRKAEWAAKRAESFEAGGRGEAEVARVLAPLTAVGWFLLHDRDLPAGGNVDHIAVGPPGVAVIDLNSAFADTHRSGVLVEDLTIASLIHTISGNTPGILKVKILVDGKERDTLAGHADLSSFYDVTAVNQLATQLQSPESRSIRFLCRF